MGIFDELLKQAGTGTTGFLRGQNVGRDELRQRELEEEEIRRFRQIEDRQERILQSDEQERSRQRGIADRERRRQERDVEVGRFQDAANRRDREAALQSLGIDPQVAGAAATDPGTFSSIVERRTRPEEPPARDLPQEERDRRTRQLIDVAGMDPARARAVAGDDELFRQAIQGEVFPEGDREDLVGRRNRALQVFGDLSSMISGQGAFPPTERTREFTEERLQRILGLGGFDSEEALAQEMREIGLGGLVGGTEGAAPTEGVTPAPGVTQPTSGRAGGPGGGTSEALQELLSTGVAAPARPAGGGDSDAVSEGIRRVISGDFEAAGTSGAAGDEVDDLRREATELVLSSDEDNPGDRDRLLSFIQSADAAGLRRLLGG